MARTYILRKGEAVLSDLADGGSMTYPGNYPGQVYFVNNVTGDSSYDGLSWESPFAQLVTAITAATAFQAAQVSNNQNVRNIIYVQGTATAYDAVTTLPSYCDIIGVGADPRGNGAGIARIGSDTGTTDGVDATTTARGVNFYNLQFQAGGGGYAFRGTDLYRCRWENCTFATNGTGTAPAAGFSAAKCSGNVWINCHWINAGSIGNTNAVGFQMTGTHFHNCLVEDCYISGDAAAVEIASVTVSSWGSIFKNCYIGWGSETCDIGVDDNATAGHIIYSGCTVFATDSFELSNNGTNRIIGCTAANAYAT